MLSNENEFWLKNIHGEVLNFLEYQKSFAQKGYYNYSHSGDMYNELIHWNLGSSVFALRIYYCLGIEKNQDIINACNYIKSFLHDDGMIYDDFIYKKSFTRNFLASIKNKNFSNLLNAQYKRAESRQSYSALMLYDELPKDINIDFPKNKNEIDEYLSKLNWNEPWGAGSHFSHLMFFYRLSYQSKLIDKQLFDKLVGYALDWIDNIIHKDTGGWYKGKQDNRYIVNGAMKILTGLIAVDKTEFKYPKELIDTCLKATNDIDACDNFNIILVLNYASKLLNRRYRHEEIEKFALNRLEKYKAHYKNNQGGFSFFPYSSNIKYYGAKITKGFSEADMHGTFLFVFGISIIIQILGLEDEFDYKEFLT